MKQTEENKGLDKWVFWPAIILLTIMILVGIFFHRQMGDMLNSMLYWMADTFGWYVNLISLLCLILSVVFIIYKYGDLKIGGRDAQPDFKIFHWCAMSICGGIGTGLLFWAIGEPIYHFAEPPVAAGVKAFSREAGIFAISQSMWDWSFVQYAMYSLCAVAFAIVTYNCKKSLSFGSLVEQVFGRPIPWLTTVIHGCTIFCLCIAVANSMGVGLLQTGAGVEAVFGVSQSYIVWLAISIVMGTIFIVSCTSGIRNGLKRISSFTMYMFFALLLYVVCFGNAEFIGKISVEGVGNLLDHWASKTVITNVMADQDIWPANFTIQYWTAFIVYSPVIGMFLSRMAKGRTIRQFVLVNVLVPSVFCCIWIGIFGGMTIHLQFEGIMDVWGAVNQYGMQSTVFQILSSLPMGTAVTVFFLIAVCLSFCTLADPMSSVLATLCVRQLSVNDEAPRNIKIFMGILITVFSYLLVASGGITAIKSMNIFIGLIMSFTMILCVVAAFRLSASNLAMNKEAGTKQQQIQKGGTEQRYCSEVNL